MSVEPRPPATTSAPCAAAPRPNASASGGEEARMSCMTTIVPAPVTRANAAPIASVMPSSSWSGTTPLMSYALTMLARSPNADLAYGLLVGPRSRLGLHHRVRERFQVIGAVLGRFHGQPHHVPAARRGQPGGVLFAQVVAVRLDIGRQRPEHRGGVAVHVRQRVDGRMLACGA